jgi:hypothetical protein
MSSVVGPLWINWEPFCLATCTLQIMTMYLLLLLFYHLCRIGNELSKGWQSEVRY